MQPAKPARQALIFNWGTLRGPAEQTTLMINLQKSESKQNQLLEPKVELNGRSIKLELQVQERKENLNFKISSLSCVASSFHSAGLGLKSFPCYSIYKKKLANN